MDTDTSTTAGADLGPGTGPAEPGPVDLGPVCRATARVAAGIPDELLDGPTPCPAYTVRGMLAHLAGLTIAFRDAAGKKSGPTTDTAPEPGSVPELAEGWRALLPRQLDELAEAWRDPAAWEGATRVGGVDLPGGVAGVVALDEVLVHGWDLARATGQGYEADEAGLWAAYGMLAAPRPAEGIFAPPVAVPQDAPLLDRVIGLSGRRPDWRPGE
ncbi:TIGR03086 family metal-binding protein [Streptomyces liangshanensis]|uniref:TIGR03086 family protein n=1 Tax=Streptomyces liangshanensis TaxID=2717324 RepID=A0A6G9GUL4_9ACTN|nr:TIGR03086 family metal-binding protein [Streptomyces liangshanensis]QIQ01948.1 TIGR03086 family protein [Streptomyces liangshanensis]